MLAPTRMKIGVFTDVYFPDFGGVQVVISLMERILREHGHEVMVFAPAYPGYRDERPEVCRLPSVRVGPRRNWRLSYPSLGRVASAAQELDIVHSHTCFTMGLLAAQVARLRNVPHVHTYHTLVREYRRALASGLPKPLEDRWMRSFLQRCDLVITPSRDAQWEVESYGVCVPTVVMPCGVDEREFAGPPTYDLRSELKLHRTRLLLFVGRLGKEKNVGFLLRVLAILAARRDDVHLVIVGDGPSRAELEQQARGLGLAGRVSFCGYVPRERVIHLYRQVDLFVFASMTESQGLVVLEAMMAGTPPVAVEAPGVRDLVRSGTDGVLVPHDEEAFAAACEDLLNNPQRRQALAAAARERARSLSAQSYVQGLVATYEELRRTRTATPMLRGRAGRCGAGQGTRARAPQN